MALTYSFPNFEPGSRSRSGSNSFLTSKTTAYGDCSHEIKKRLLLGRRAMTNLDSMLKSRDITLLTKVHMAKAMVWNSSSHERM